MTDMDDRKEETLKTAAKKQGKEASVFKEAALTIFWALIIAIVVRTFAYEPFNIPSGSMKPTLLIGDYIFVSKFSYGYSRYSLPGSLNLFDGRILGSEPERGDVIVFRKPPENAEDYIKRLVGMPGDRIQLIEGVLHINGTAVKREKVAVDFDNENGFPRRLTHFRETLPNGVVHSIWEESDEYFTDNTREYVVPEGHYFMMGDNRDHSSDSRAIGAIPYENLIGRADIVFVSLDGAELFQFWTWPWTMRFDRLFNGIE
ncbi:MAG: signal peptidase I [Kiloniellales bacterium]|nr:signal peptidase I [Kiloniellales bacterium]